MQVGERGVCATRANLLSAAARFEFTSAEASAEIDRVQTCVRTHWDARIQLPRFRIRMNGRPFGHASEVRQPFASSAFTFGVTSNVSAT